MTFKKKFERIPTFVIDGVDLIAKKDSHMFIDLVDRAKHLANSCTLQVVFVSSEGHVLPLLDKTFSTTRKAPMIEILDITNGEAENLLSKVMPKPWASSVVEVIGGRLIHIAQALVVYSMYKNKKMDIFNKIKQELKSEYFDSCVIEALTDGNVQIKKTILQEAVARGSISPTDLVKDQEHSEEEIMRAVKNLLDIKLLRFQGDRMVTYHSKLVYRR